MPSALEELPLEVIHQICHTLIGCSSLTKLLQVDKHFYTIIRPMLWENIELHPPGLHEHYLYDEEVAHDEALKAHKARNYHLIQDYLTPKFSAQDDFAYRDHLTTPFLQTLSWFGSESWNLGAMHVPACDLIKSLCLELYIGDIEHSSVDEVWAILHKLQNLETLELTADWVQDETCRIYTASEVFWEPLRKLRNLSLRGYVPRAVVRYLCSTPENIRDLELGILDRPYGNSSNEPPDPAEHEAAEEDDEISISSDPTDYAAEEFTSPRPLAALLGSGLIERFTSLQKLSLLRPMSPLKPGEDDDDFMRDVIVGYVSERYQREVLSEWNGLLKAARLTLQHLVLDQRPACEDIAQDSSGDLEFMFTSAYGEGYQTFKEVVLPVIKEQPWPVLRFVRLYGFDVPLNCKQHASFPKYL